MKDLALNILSLGIRPFYKRHTRFHAVISDFRNKLASPNLSEAEIDEFYTELADFDSSFVLFPKYYRQYILNLNRWNPKAEDGEFDGKLLEVALAENKWKPTAPYPIFVHHLKYKYKITSKFFIAQQKRKNRKELNKPGAQFMQTEKAETSKAWTRVPLPKNRKDNAPQ